MYPVILGFHIFVSILLIIAVLLQSGKGSSLSEAFGAGSSDIFGSVSPANIMNKITTILVVIFFFTSIALTVISSKGTGNSITNKLPAAAAPIGEQNTTPQVPLESK
ncbi:preprotein translocase subunit SecG [Deferribacteraceae bacterium V6Fe1]|uniref:preprotein translocase subunit SecG n=1 Tax=Deferrivibrio essentukiensis TaxID=2880922 RepID=UPI001F61BDB0|nr:preprotein translocase subunit SecG [Deferrivibrio essentukiensis]MCB4204247.1 preprotein translocase subunit SecG [Deferrivibrio essentukiensis]UOD34781.1 preprotein translocase subunit SecG [Deferribacteraceae bacterium V6Fe1]